MPKRSLLIHTTPEIRIKPIAAGPIIDFRAPDTTTVRIQALRPFMADVLGDDGKAYDALAAMHETDQRKWFTRHIGEANIEKGSRVRVARVRDGTYHGEKVEGASITAFATVPAAVVDRLRKASGEKGLLHNSTEDDSVAKVHIGGDYHVNDILQRARDLKQADPNLYGAFFGIVPAHRGNYIRVADEARNAARQFFDPVRAGVLGPAAAVQVNSH